VFGHCDKKKNLPIGMTYKTAKKVLEEDGFCSVIVLVISGIDSFLFCLASLRLLMGVEVSAMFNTELLRRREFKLSH
jgi:hypothetical protein